MEVAGLAVGAVGLVGLFTSCLEAFDIVVSVREFGSDLEVLIADLDLQRLRFSLWGDALGLLPLGGDGVSIRQSGLQDPQTVITISHALEAVLHLLSETGRLRDRFSRPFSSSRRLDIFRATFSAFQDRARANQRLSSRTSAVKWAFHSRDQFKDKLDRLKSLIEGLEKVSESLGVLQIQRQRMRTEIESLDDVASLRLIMDVTATEERELSDVASVRIAAVTEASIRIRQIAQSVEESFVTAPSESTDNRGAGLLSDEEVGTDDALQSIRLPQIEGISDDWFPARAMTAPWKAGPKTDSCGSKLAAFDVQGMASICTFPPSLSYVQDKLLAFHINNPPWGIDHTAKGKYATTRIRKELSKANDETMPWVAFASEGGRLDHLVAAIEGPPDTPFESGVFWIEIVIRGDYPIQPPLLRFLTRIYHPNIDWPNMCRRFGRNVDSGMAYFPDFDLHLRFTGRSEPSRSLGTRNCRGLS